MKLIRISLFECLFEFVKLRFEFCVSTSCFLPPFLGVEITANVVGAADDDDGEKISETVLFRDDPDARISETGTTSDDDEDLDLDGVDFLSTAAIVAPDWLRRDPNALTIGNFGSDK